MLKQRTIKSLIKTVGIGLHSGRRVTLTLCPTAADTGIVFTRIDLDPAAEIPATASAIGDTHLTSMLRKDSTRVSTVEHLMSACTGLGIGNLCVDVDTEEIPIMDGSAASFMFLLQSAGIEEQDAAKRFIRMTKPVEVRESDKLARLDSYFSFKLSFTIKSRHPTVDKTGQTFKIDSAGTSYTREVTHARIFSFAHEIEVLHGVDLARGGSLDNAIVLDEHCMLNSDELRYDDEFVHHKILDATGDPCVVGHPLIAVYTTHKSGHGLNNVLPRTLLVDETAYEMVTLDKVGGAPRAFLPQ